MREKTLHTLNAADSHVLKKEPKIWNIYRCASVNIPYYRHMETVVQKIGVVFPV